MTRPRDAWDHEQSAPRRVSYYPGGQSQQPQRLPPPSSIIDDSHHGQATLNGRDGTFPDHMPPEVGASMASMPAHGPAQVPISGPEDHAFVARSPRRPLFDARTSTMYSSTAGDRSEDLPVDSSDYPYFRQPVQGQRFSPGRPSSQLPSAHERPPHQSPHANAQLMGPFHGPGSQHARMSLLPQASSSVHWTRSPQPSTRAPERMKIADILSHEQNSSASESPRASQKTPQRSLSLASAASMYRISIRQQPVAARSCGYGERDRRVIDPPPILQLKIEDPTVSDEEIQNRLSMMQHSIMHCTIWNEAGDQDLSSMHEDCRPQRRLMGTIVSSPFAGFDENDEFGCFFCFPDLSCRTPGSFRLQFSFMVLDPSSAPGHRTPVAAKVMSDGFTVYNAKDFPGMQASTALTRKLKEQGCLISIKKGNDKTRAREETESDNDDNENMNRNDGNGQRRAKRARKL